MATKKIKQYHSALPAATSPSDTMSVISTDGSADKQIPLESLATYVRGKLSDLDRVMDSLGSYTERASITLSPTQTDKAISADGALVSKSGWAIAQFTAELGNEYLFKPGETSSDVCVFAEKVDKVETRAIDYAYTYGSDGKVSTATATYNGKTYVYTYTYASDGQTTITDASGNVVSSLPSVYTTTVGSYQPMTRLNANAELPKDGYCRFVSNFQAASSITVVVSYKVGSADLTMRVLRDGMTASMCTQLSKINQKVDNVTAAVPKMWMRLLADKDTWVRVNGKEVEIKAHKNYRFTDVSDFSVAVNGKSANPKCIKHLDIHYNDFFPVDWLQLAPYVTPVDEEKRNYYGCGALTSLDVSGLDTSKVTNMSMMFRGCSSLTAIDVSGWDTSNSSTFEGFFYGCSGLASVEVSGWNTSKGLYFSGVFFDCRQLTEIGVSGWDMSKAEYLNNMFYGCASLTSLDLGSWQTSNVGAMLQVFRGCTSLTTLNLSSWDLSSATNITDMFSRCTSLTDITFGEGFGKAKASGLTLDLSSCGSAKSYALTENTYNTLLTLYDRAANGLPTMTIKFSTHHTLPEGFEEAMTAKGYVITKG